MDAKKARGKKAVYYIMLFSFLHNTISFIGRETQYVRYDEIGMHVLHEQPPSLTELYLMIS